MKRYEIMRIIEYRRAVGRVVNYVQDGSLTMDELIGMGCDDELIADLQEIIFIRDSLTLDSPYGLRDM